MQAFSSEMLVAFPVDCSFKQFRAFLFNFLKVFTTMWFILGGFFIYSRI